MTSRSTIERVSPRAFRRVAIASHEPSPPARIRRLASLLLCVPWQSVLCARQSLCAALHAALPERAVAPPRHDLRAAHRPACRRRRRRRRRRRCARARFTIAMCPVTCTLTPRASACRRHFGQSLSGRLPEASGARAHVCLLCPLAVSACCVRLPPRPLGLNVGLGPLVSLFKLCVRLRVCSVHHAVCSCALTPSL